MRYATLIGFLLTLAGCSNVGPSETPAAETQALKDAEAAGFTAIGSKDLEKWVAFYADDASVLLPTAPPITGKDAIRNGLKPLVSDPNFHLTATNEKTVVARGGDFGYTRGTYAMVTTDPNTKQPVTEHGKYLTTFRKVDGKWLAVDDMVSPDMPAPGAAH
jgi:ketosteroid isomerase-like protein